MTDQSKKNTDAQLNKGEYLAVDHINITYGLFKEAAKDLMNK